MSRRRTTKEFIDSARSIHGEKYDYSQSVYTKSCDKILIICPIHGDFHQNANNHLSGKGCAFCSGYKKIRVDLSHIVNSDGSRLIPLAHGKTAIVDGEDYERVNNFFWHCDNKGYVSAKIGNRRVLMHRYIMNCIGKKAIIDHVNRIKTDNRKSNLRTCSPQQNNMNRPGLIGSTSKYKGVNYYSKGEWHGWVARITLKGKGVYLGTFDKEYDAARAYDKKAVELFGDFAYLNFPSK